MKLNKLVFAAFVFPALLSCGQPTRISVIVDASAGVEADTAGFTNQLMAALAAESLTAKLDYRVMNGAMAEAKKAPLDAVSRYAQEKPSDPAFLLVFKPYLDSASRKVRFEALAASHRSVLNLLTVSDKSLPEMSEIIPSLREFAHAQGEKALDHVYVWGPKKLVVLAFVDNPSNLSFQEDRFFKTFESFAGNVYSGPIEFKRLPSGSFDLLTNGPSGFIQSNAGASLAVLGAVRPYLTLEGSNGVEFIVGGSKAEPGKAWVSTNLIDDAFMSYKDTRDSVADPETEGWFYWKRAWNAPVSNTNKPAPVVADSTEYMEYKRYREVLDLDGRYLLITSVSDIAPDGRFRLSSLIPGGRFDPKVNPVALSIKKIVADKGLLSLFIDTNGSKIAGFTFFEYVTTGDTYGRLLYGPVEETNIQAAKDSFAGSGITVFARSVRGSDFR